MSRVSYEADTVVTRLLSGAVTITTRVTKITESGSAEPDGAVISTVRTEVVGMFTNRIEATND